LADQGEIIHELKEEFGRGGERFGGQLEKADKSS
jgi:hypothetical protein